LRGGISFPPWLRFRRPPDNPGRPDFPGPVRNLGLSSVSLPSFREVQALARIHPDFGGLPTASFHHIRRFIAGSESDHRAVNGTAKIQSPFAPVRCYLLGGGVCRLLGRHCSSVIAPMDSCAIPVWLSPPSANASFRESLQVATSPCCRRVLPDVISASLS